MAYKDKANAIKYNNEFNKQAYDRIALNVKKGRKATIRAYAENQNESVNEFINTAIDERIERIEKR